MQKPRQMALQARRDAYDTFPKAPTHSGTTPKRQRNSGLTFDWSKGELKALPMVSNGKLGTKGPSPMGQAIRYEPRKLSEHEAQAHAKRTREIIRQGNLSLKGLWYK